MREIDLFNMMMWLWVESDYDTKLLSYNLIEIAEQLTAEKWGLA